MPNNLNELAAHEANGLAYKTMNFGIYAGVAVAIYVTEAYLAILIDDIGPVIGFVGAIAGVSISYFIPSLLFNVGFSKFATTDFKVRFSGWKTISNINFLLGIFFFVLFMYSNIMSVASGKSGGGH